MDMSAIQGSVAKFEGVQSDAEFAYVLSITYARNLTGFDLRV